MKDLSKAIKRIGTESAFAVGPEITAVEKKGYQVIRLNIGEPGCGIDDTATKASINALRYQKTHYTPSAGAETLRDKIAAYMRVTHGVNYRANNIILSPGGKPVIMGTALILLNPNDEVVYPTPCYPIYESAIDFVGAKRVPLLLKEENGFRFDIKELKQKISSKTKLLILNSPSNPTGGILTKNDLKIIAQLAKKHDFYILSDEVYNRIVYGRDAVKVKWQGRTIPIAESIASLPGMAARTIVLDSFSKTYAMTGLRVGFACSQNQEFIGRFLTLAINLWSCLPEPCMAAAEAALMSDQVNAQKEIKLYRQKRDLALAGLSKIDSLKCHAPMGSFYFFVNVTQACRKLKLKDAEALRRYLLTYDKKNKKGVAVLSRQHFGRKLTKERQEYIRLSFAGKIEDIKEGIIRIREAIG